MEKVLIIGANGFLGLCLLNKFKQDFDVYSADLNIDLIDKTFKPICLDITNPDEVSKIISKIKPGLTILTAAMTNVDSCEDFPEKAMKINSLGPKNVAHSMKKINGRLISLSTDYVFDGKKGNYIEEDITNPINVYGRSKLDGEKYIIESGVLHLICRTSVLFGWPVKTQHENFFSWAYNQLNERKTVKVVKDQINSPTLVDDLSECLFKMAYFSNSGIYHTCGRERINRYDFIKKLIVTFQLDENLLEGVKSFPQKAPRPYDVSLRNIKTENFFQFMFRDIFQSFNYLKEIKNKSKKI